MPRNNRLVFFALILVTVVAAIQGILTSPAAASASASVPPKIISASPYTGMLSGWGGETISATFEPATRNGRPDPLVENRCDLWVNGVLAKGVRRAVSEAPYGSTIQFSNFPSVPKGTVNFRVVLKTKSGQKAEKSWSFAATGEKVPGLINPGLMREWSGYIVRGIGWTLYITVISAVLACVFGLIGALGRLMKTMTFRAAWKRHHSWAYMAGHTLRMIPYWLATFYASIFRGTPLLLQIYLIYYALPAFRVVTPTMGNYFISLIKDTSLLSVIAVPEILKRAQLVGGMFYDYLSPLLVAAIIYWGLTIFFNFWQGKLERRLHRDRARA